MPIRAVIFDLYGTLVPEFPHEEFYASIDHIATVVGADVEAFRDAWNATVAARKAHTRHAEARAYAPRERVPENICRLRVMPGRSSPKRP